MTKEEERTKTIRRLRELVESYGGEPIRKISEQDPPNVIGWETEIDEIYGELSAKMTDADINDAIEEVCDDWEQEVHRLQELIEVARVIKGELFRRRVSGCRTTTGYDTSAQPDA